MGLILESALYRQNSGDTVDSSDSDMALSLSDMVYGFLEECQSSPEQSSVDGFGNDGEEEDSFDLEESRTFWENQEQLLLATLCRTTSIESNIRQATKEALRELNSTSGKCSCGKDVAGGCRDCLRRDVSFRLQNAGHNCSICKSKWRSSSETPSGEHTYLEVVDNSNPKKGEVRVIIELNFRAEFEMGRANDAYNRLTSRLPEVFVGKAERLRALIKIMCGAAKKCMKEKKMHLGPWRKIKYMQAKWFGTSIKRSTPPVPELTTGFPEVRQPKPRASMLTFDLLDNLPNLHCPTAIRVL